ncbi:DUF547 domain-containing protein [uncultured Aquimarina sp.]|uniref:DUF547 domain-containing protein n=1 Tax=uncultured Aquimarina sp. TaxID=575652 RepID=UPI00262E701B|nr:DUF547 domain-containing protein [uncultured Aquimarina sp.]
MQKVFLLLSILVSLSGCTSEKKEKKINIQTENTIVIEDPINKNKVKDTITKTKIIVKKETIDYVLNSTRNKKVEEKTKDDTPRNEETKEKVVVKEIEKIKSDHTIWNLLTKKYVSTTGKVNYKGFKANIAQIETYLLHLQNIAPQKDWTKNEKLAYWFNLYNASTIHLVASTYPVKSIKDINNGKPWDKKFIKSGSEIYSLNEIENTIVRPNFNEPRLHVAFNCAAVSCPKLLNEAFTPTKLNSQLSKLSSAWINDPSKNKVTENDLEISKIFDWYGVDFKKGIIPFINQYTDTKVNDSIKIKYLEYNWDLND